jgi:hypothetical protein
LALQGGTRWSEKAQAGKFGGYAAKLKESNYMAKRAQREEQESAAGVVSLAEAAAGKARRGTAKTTAAKKAVAAAPKAEKSAAEKKATTEAGKTAAAEKAAAVVKLRTKAAKTSAAKENVPPKAAKAAKPNLTLVPKTARRSKTAEPAAVVEPAEAKAAKTTARKTAAPKATKAAAAAKTWETALNAAVPPPSEIGAPQRAIVGSPLLSAAAEKAPPPASKDSGGVALSNERADVARRILELSETIGEAVDYMLSRLTVPGTYGDLSAKQGGLVVAGMLKEIGEGLMSLEGAASSICGPLGTDAADVHMLASCFDDISERLDAMIDAYLENRASDLPIIGALLRGAFLSYAELLSRCFRSVALI